MVFKVGDKVRPNGGRIGEMVVDLLIVDHPNIVFDVVEIAVGADIIRIIHPEFLQAWTYVFADAFDLVVEEVPEVVDNRKLLPHGFHVGDRVYYIIDFGRAIGAKKYGTVVDDRRQSENNVFADWADNGFPTIGFMPKNKVFLDNPAPVKKKEGPMTRFVFCSRGGKYYAKSDHPTLELATNKAKRMRALHQTDDIYPFVIVED